MSSLNDSIDSNLFAFGPSSSNNDGARRPTAAVLQEICDNGIDDDGDGVNDASDAFPLDFNVNADLDGDGLGNAQDPDIDNDGIVNTLDVFPYDNSEWFDTDGDTIGDLSLIHI